MSRDGFTEIILSILSEAWMRKELSSEADLQLALRVCAYTVLHLSVERNTKVAFDSHTTTQTKRNGTSIGNNRYNLTVSLKFLVSSS